MASILVYDVTKNFERYFGIVASMGIPCGWRFEFSGNREGLETARKEDLYDLVLAGNLSVAEFKTIMQKPSNTPLVILDGNNPELRDLALQRGLEVITLQDKQGIIINSIVGAYNRHKERLQEQ